MSIYSLKCTKGSWDFGIYAGVGKNRFNEQAAVVKCAQHYAKDNHKSIFTYILYRIHQCVLAIFLQSDWQIARNKLMQSLKSAEDFHQIIDLKEVNNPTKWEYLVEGILLSLVMVYNQDNTGCEYNEWDLSFKIVDKNIKILCVDYKNRFQAENSPFTETFYREHLN